jgi:hypothetical protein
MHSVRQSLEMDTQHATLPTNPTDLATQITKLQKTIRDAGDFVDEGYRTIDAYEDQYRTLGVAYHTTQLIARRSDLLGSDTIGLLQKAFEISTKDEYNVFHAPIIDFRRILNKARDEIRPNGRPGELMRRAEMVQDLEDLMVLHLRKFGFLKLCNVRDALVQTNAVELRVIHNSNVEPWAKAGVYEPVYIEDLGHERMFKNAKGDIIDLKHSYMFRNGEEWRLYRAWIGCLPETTRAVQAGRSLDEIAVDMFYGQIKE